MRHRGAILAVAATLLVVPAVSTAAAPSHGEHGHAHGVPWATLFFMAVNFSIFLWLLARFVWPQVRLWLRERHTTVVNELQAAAKLREEAERLHGQWLERMARVDEEIAELRRSVLRDLEREREQVLEEAKRTAEAIRRDAERQTVAEFRRLEAELRAELVARAHELAKEMVRRHWTVADQRRSIEEFLRQVPS